MPTAARSSESESGSRRTPVAIGERPTTTERNSGTMKKMPDWIRNMNRKLMSPPVSWRFFSSEGAISGSLPVRSSRCW